MVPPIAPRLLRGGVHFKVPSCFKITVLVISPHLSLMRHPKLQPIPEPKPEPDPNPTISVNKSGNFAKKCFAAALRNSFGGTDCYHARGTRMEAFTSALNGLRTSVYFVHGLGH